MIFVFVSVSVYVIIFDDGEENIRADDLATGQINILQ